MNKLTSTMEDYLEAIYSLKKEKGVARVGEIADKLDVKSSTVNSAIKFLSDQGLVIHERYGYVDLTKEGGQAALEIRNKHDVLFYFLTKFLMLDTTLAEKEACSIEHSIGERTFLRLRKFLRFLEKDAIDGRLTAINQMRRYFGKNNKTKI